MQDELALHNYYFLSQLIILLLRKSNAAMNYEEAVVYYLEHLEANLNAYDCSHCIKLVDKSVGTSNRSIKPLISYVHSGVLLNYSSELEERMLCFPSCSFLNFILGFRPPPPPPPPPRTQIPRSRSGGDRVP